MSRETLQTVFKQKTQSEWVSIFENLDACVSPVLNLDEAPYNKHNSERGSFIQTQDKSTWLPTMNWLDKSANEHLELPEIGQHSSVILEKLGYSSNDIQKLLENDVVEQNAAKVNSKL